MSLSLIVSGWACDQSWDRKWQAWEFYGHYWKEQPLLLLGLYGWQDGGQEFQEAILAVAVGDSAQDEHH